VRALASSPFVGQRLRVLSTKETNQDLVALAAFMETGKLTPVIDKTYPLSEVPDAIRHLEAGHARGKIIIKA
jgi:NADPH:quinone reductase-like Zn-dependent oxidoreductase